MSENKRIWAVETRHVFSDQYAAQMVICSKAALVRSFKKERLNHPETHNYSLVGKISNFGWLTVCCFNKICSFVNSQLKQRETRERA